MVSPTSGDNPEPVFVMIGERTCSVRDTLTIPGEADRSFTPDFHSMAVSLERRHTRSCHLSTHSNRSIVPVITSIFVFFSVSRSLLLA